MPRFAETVRVVGTGITRLGKFHKPASELMAEALERSLASASLTLSDLDGLIAVPSLSDPKLMQAHYIATKVMLLPRRNFLVRTLDTGGAGPITALLEARRMIIAEHCQAVAVVAGDSVSSMTTEEFLARADAGIGSETLPSPVIPHGYSRVSEWHQNMYNVSREQLAKVPVLMSHQASRHPHAITKRRYKLDEVLNSPSITPQLNLLECARRMDGAGSFIVASSRFLEKRGILNKGNGGHGDCVVLAGGEASGPLSPPTLIDETMFSCEAAAQFAFTEAQVSPDEIDFFGLYDCFPICFLRAIEAVGICEKGKGGAWIDDQYDRVLADENYVPIVNTHGGLLSFGAPWEAPAIFSVNEAVRQLTGRAENQQMQNCRKALVYGNGGIFSSSAVAILSKPVSFTN